MVTISIIETTRKTPLTPIATYLTLEALSNPHIIDITVTATGINSYLQLSVITYLPNSYLV